MELNDDDGRPRRDGRGRLRIYLGAAAGVGKTYAMLNEGHRRQERGTDLVVAFVETHGRVHTAALLAGLEIIPRATIAYRGAVFEEMDLAAVLARDPQVALVDEFAHTNVPGSSNAKRWQDVEELLAAGIDVISTLNIQHLESLNDVVAEDHRRAAAGDRAGRGGPRRRPGRAGRHDPRGAAPPDGARQHLPGREDRRGADPLLPGRQPGRAARAGPALAGRQGRRGAAALPGRARHPRAPGRPASGWWSR